LPELLKHPDLIPGSLLRRELFPDLCPSFPNASIGNPGEIGTIPPIKTFGYDVFGSFSTLL
jgi:hypothetical protein